MTEPEVAGEEPASERGFSVAEFESPGVLHAIRQALDLLPSDKRVLLLAAAAIQVSLGILDLIGIALIGLVAAVAVSGIGTTGIPGWAQTAIDAFGGENLTVSQLSVILAGSAVTVLVLKTVLSALLSRRIITFLANRQAELAGRLSRQLLRRPMTDVQKWTTSEATYALSGGTGAATVTLLGNGITIAAEIFLFAILGVSLLIFDPILTITAGVFFLIIVLFLHRVLGNWTTRNSQIITEANIATLSTVSEALLTYREAMVLNRRDLYSGRYERLVKRLARANAKNAFLVEVPKYVLEAALYLGVLLLAVVQFLTKDWAAAASTVAVFLAAGSRITPSLLRLQGAAITVRNAAVQAQPTFFMADELKRMDAREPAVTGSLVTARHISDVIKAGYPDFDGSIHATDVWVTYPGAAEPALIAVDLIAASGSSVALVGSTGAGKSTLSDVILGVLDPDEGTVTIGGALPKEAIQRWPGAITYVPQAVALVAGTVRENVALGLPAEMIDDDIVWDALKRAHIADFLVQSREGLDTFIGERGFRLSGGQRQRLGIARALYTRPKLLVLDEATSALDSETEQSIIATLEDLEGEVTTLTVAHRLATVRRADQLLYLKDGRLMAHGTFDEVRGQVPDFDRQASLLGL
jgi:ABC-type multidrug transport system fused ATPase/permease subunit